MAHDGGPSECYARQATDLLASLAPAGSTITIRPDPGQPDRDRYDRLLRYVDIEVDVDLGDSAGQDGSGPDAGDVDATERLLELGAAELYRNDPALQRGDEYAAAFTAAQNRGAGQWTACAS